MSVSQIGVSRDFTPSDSEANNINFDFVMATVAGTISITMEDNSVTSLVAMPAGTWMGFSNGVRINATGTTATGLMVM